MDLVRTEEEGSGQGRGVIGRAGARGLLPFGALSLPSGPALIVSFLFNPVSPLAPRRRSEVAT